jgi:phenylpropionate dioxygenase-like ring-hydroxylating dioxygenase large terminal subunit
VLLGERLVVYRTLAGRPVVGARHCPHRGADLCLGAVEGESIVCRYHGWRWDAADGRCLGIPSLGDDGAIPPRAILPTYRSDERYGLVWCCLEDPVVPIPAPPVLDDLDWEYGQGEPLPQNCGIRSATENFRDVAHFPFVHRTSMGHVSHAVEPLAVTRDGTEVRLSRTYNAHGGTAEAIWHSDMKWAYHAFAPAFVCLVMESPAGGSRVILNAPSPVSGTESVLFWVQGKTPDFPAPPLPESMAMEAEVFAEDKVILDSIDPPEAPLDPDVQVHTAADRYTLEYRRAFIEFVHLANQTRTGDARDGA